MRRPLIAASVLAISLAPAGVAGQTFGVGLKAGTLGLGADVAVGLHDRIALRGGFGVFPFTPRLTYSDIEYDAELPSPQFTGTADLFLIGGLRLTGGVLVSTPDFVLTSDLTNLGTVDIGGVQFDGSDVGVMSGAVVNNDVAPYVGLGFGRVAKRGFGFFVDAAVAFQGEPVVALAATGPIRDDPDFQSALRAEEQALAEEIKLAKYYPILSVGLSFGF
jgi:hypothetical protein